MHPSTRTCSVDRADELLGQPDRPEWKGDNLLDVASFGKRQLTAASAQVDHNNLPDACAGLRSPRWINRLLQARR